MSGRRPARALMERLRDPRPLVAVELRPPRAGMAAAQSMGTWIDMRTAIRRLSRQDTFILLTDDAAGDAEEESLRHLAANLGSAADFGAVVPFLTCKHALDYCRMFAVRAWELPVGAVAVVGGDHSVGPDRCVPHSKDLRRILRREQPALPLGGWANPHRDPVGQARFVAARDFAADFVLTQIVSHHSLRQVEVFQNELARLGVDVPVVYGVFRYRSANPGTLRRLGRYFPVPAREIEREFAAGADAEEICLRTIRELRAIGVDKVYVSNLGPGSAARELARLASG